MNALSFFGGRIAILVVVALSVFGFGYKTGADAVQAAWDAQKNQQMLNAAQTAQQQAEVSTQTVVQYVDRVQIVREKGAAITKEVKVYVPSNSCALPGSFRLLHDAAATNSALPATTGGVDAPTVNAQDLAETVTNNYTTCHEIREQLTALQNWVRAQASLGEKNDQ